jgi:hypothetical protein
VVADGFRTISFTSEAIAFTLLDFFSRVAFAGVFAVKVQVMDASRSYVGLGQGGERWWMGMMVCGVWWCLIACWVVVRDKDVAWELVVIGALLLLLLLPPPPLLLLRCTRNETARRELVSNKQIGNKGCCGGCDDDDDAQTLDRRQTRMIRARKLMSIGCDFIYITVYLF